MSYVDGFVMVVPKKNIKAYTKMAKMGRKAWMKHGALQYFECAGDDLEVPYLTMTFPKLLKLKATETAFFSFIIYKSRAHRDKVNKKVMSDPAMQAPPKKMPFDMKRMTMGGFKAIVES